MQTGVADEAETVRLDGVAGVVLMEVENEKGRGGRDDLCVRFAC